MKEQDKEMFGENNEIGTVLGHAGIMVFYGIIAGAIAWGLYYLLCSK